MKVKIITVVLLMLSASWFGENLFAELAKSDVEEIRRIMKEEIQHMDKRIDDLRDTLRSEIGALRSEISDVKTANKDIKSEIKDMKSELQGFMLWGFGIVFAGIFALIGFVLWDRRTALAPAIRKNQELEDRENKIEMALKEYAEKEPRLKEILKHIGLM